MIFGDLNMKELRKQCRTKQFRGRYIQAFQMTEENQTKLMPEKYLMHSETVKCHSLKETYDKYPLETRSIHIEGPTKSIDALEREVHVINKRHQNIGVTRHKDSMTKSAMSVEYESPEAKNQAIEEIKQNKPELSNLINKITKLL